MGAIITEDEWLDICKIPVATSTSLFVFFYYTWNQAKAKRQMLKGMWKRITFRCFWDFQVLQPYLQESASMIHLIISQNIEYGFYSTFLRVYGVN